MGRTDVMGTIDQDTPHERRVNCPLKYGPLNWGKDWATNEPLIYNLYTTMCIDSFIGATPSHLDWQKSQSCPKGWGRAKWANSSNYYSTNNAQGYINDNSTPVYSDITKYRTAYHNYITTRVAKA